MSSLPRQIPSLFFQFALFLSPLLFTLKAISFPSSDELNQSADTYAGSSVIINAPIDEVWQYNSNNKNASQWSIFFNEISGCPISDCPSNKGLKESDIGFIRRAYRKKGESDLFWDEETIQVDKSPERYRRVIRAFNFRGYTEGYRKAEQIVVQTYVSLNKTKTKLSFESQLLPLENHAFKNEISNLDYFVWKIMGKYFARKRANEIFKKNLVNIKDAIEQKENYQRKYAFEEPKWTSW